MSENIEKMLGKIFNKISEVVSLLEKNPIKVLYDKYIEFKIKTEHFIKDLLE